MRPSNKIRYATRDAALTSRFSFGELGPYALGLSMQCSPLRARLPAAARAAFADCWTPGQMAALSTRRIQELLVAEGLDVTPEGFRALVGRHSRAWAVAEEHWLPRLSPCKRGPGRGPVLESLLGMAATELWRRLVPDQPCAELLADKVDAGYRLLGAGGRSAAFSAWWEVWRAVDELAGEGPVDLDGVELIDSPLDLGLWHSDLTLEFSARAASEPELVEDCLKFLRRSVELRGPTSHDGLYLRIQRAGTLLLAGCHEEAASQLRAVLREAPADGPHRRWAAETVFFASGDPPRQDLLLLIELLTPAVRAEDGARSLGDEEPSLERQMLSWAEERLKGAAPACAANPCAEAAALAQRLLMASADLPYVLFVKVAALGPAAEPALIKVLEDPALEGWDAPGLGYGPVHAADLLGWLRATGAIPPLLRSLRRACAADRERKEHASGFFHQSELRGACCWGLAQLGAVALEPLLAAHAMSVEEDVRAELRGALCNLGVRDDRILAMCIGALNEDPASAAFQLDRCADERALPWLELRLRLLGERGTPDPGQLSVWSNEPEGVASLREAIRALGGEAHPWTGGAQLWRAPQGTGA